ncbi:hypothetical protein HII28_00355 [Planctomonas sp. JC2975]|uniref:fibronectin type III domain-containing protein n=1 Tax=Planctomonas sp. JC2975 TaxID=2729626 RepID=UPI00147411C4|nr:fibronectin type III domain-containing protein [Planctomonas sp. JC2975]NNC10336.1 hypothetical protein [Planctomonas sp. JC2975]
MAEADGFNGNSIHLALVVSVGANNVAGNYTPVSWVLNASDSYGASYSDQNATGTVNIDGAVYGYSYAWRSAGTGNRVLHSGSQNIAHNADGTRSFGFSFTFNGIPGTSNSGGASGSSSVGLAGVAPTAPSAPTADTQTIPGAVTVHWSMGSGSTPSTYTIQADDDSGFGSPLNFSASNTPATLTGLDKGTTYYIRIRGSNASGTGPFGGTISILTLSGGKRWDGSAFATTDTAKRWNGNSWVTISTGKRWNGTAWMNLQ